MPKRKKLKIAQIAAEVSPFSQTGGLGKVASSLPKALKRLNHEVLIITPFYSKLINKKKYQLKTTTTNQKIFLDEKNFRQADYLQGYLNDDLPIYFVANQKFFGQKKSIYGSNFENLRFLFFNLAALNFLKYLNWQPDIIHCHDWHTGLIPWFLNNRFKNDEFWRPVTTVFTIHNLTFQLGQNWWSIRKNLRDDGSSPLPAAEEIKKIKRINFAKRAIMNAEVINTVSETYRQEIITKDFGEDLHRVLKNRQKKVFGIINGIDYQDYNPLSDPGLKQRYSFKSPERKKANKEALQKYLKLKISPKTPIICGTSRIAEQKGFRLLLKIAEPLLRQNVQIVIMGSGDQEIAAELAKIQKKHPKKFVLIPFNSKKETSIYAGSDFFLLASRFEPCGLNQLIALRYGCIPIVHHIGGLADTIVNFNPLTGKGNGFSFKKYRPFDLFAAIIRALETYKHRETWEKLIISGMTEANSWKIPAQKYLELYKTAVKIKEKNNQKKI